MEKSDKTNFCVFYWKLQGQCWFNWGLRSRALHRGIKIVATRRIFSWKFQFNQYESNIFESKMAENPQGLFVQWAQIILKQPLIVILWLWKCWNIWKKKINVHGNLCFKLMSGSDISEVVWVLICFFTNNALLKDAISSLTLNEDIWRNTRRKSKYYLEYQFVLEKRA